MYGKECSGIVYYLLGTDVIKWHNLCTKLIETPSKIPRIYLNEFDGDLRSTIDPDHSEMQTPHYFVVKSAFTKFTKELEMNTMRPLMIMAHITRVSRSSSTRVGV
jgi:hypothetical protein